MQDFEFTIQENTLYMLQTRNGKRTGPAAVHIAVDMVEEGIIDQEGGGGARRAAVARSVAAPGVRPEGARQGGGRRQGPATPRPARPRARVAFTADDAVAWSQKGKRVLLVRKETTPDDIHGMNVGPGHPDRDRRQDARTRRWSAARMGKPSVVGCGALGRSTPRAKRAEGRRQASLKEGDWVSHRRHHRRGHPQGAGRRARRRSCRSWPASCKPRSPCCTRSS